MRNISKIQGLLSIVFIVILTWLAYLPLKTPTPKTDNEAPTSFSAYRALDQLKIIAAEPHSSGTSAHKKVRSYIYSYCKKLGLNPQTVSATGLRQFGNTVLAGNPINIIVTLKGSNPSKAVLVMSHYDSQPNSPGAADDGSGVAAMLETMRLLTKMPRLDNDIIFLFTDLEEVGLLGAEAFVNSYEDLSNVGMILNYEARGNSGASFTFETSENNGFIVRVFATAVKKPLANALAYEIYKLMPNDSDFTMFKDTGISGLNSAFVDGFSYYHSMADTPENIDLGSLQHQGDLMLDMVKYYGSLDLTDTKSEDVIFFNLFNGLVIYPISWDIPLIVFTILLFIGIVVIGLKKQQTKPKQLLVGLGLYIGSIVLSMALIWGVQQLILYLYPHYSNFYSNNFYNAGYYLWCVIGLSLLCFVVFFQPVLKKISALSLMTGAMFLLVVITIVLKYFLHTGAFMVYVPLLSALVIMLILMVWPQMKPVYQWVLQTLPLILALLMWIPFVYFLYVVFSLSLPYAAAIFVIFFFPFLLSALAQIAQLHKILPIGIALAMILFGLIAGHMTSSYNDEKPLQSQLCYMLNLDTNEAMWVSPQQNKDEWVEKYINSNQDAKIDDFFPNASGYYWRAPAELSNVATSRLQVVNDTIIDGQHVLSVRLTPSYRSNVISMWLPGGCYFTQIDDRKLSTESPVSQIRYYAPPTSGVKLRIVASRQPVPIVLIESKWGIPNQLLTHPLPDNIVFGTGSFSNSLLIRRTITLNNE
ncbi:MAG TPA: M20/M25/M40 family metallo-hydrolase [Fulvivirga sp.]|nr:M20/M25/M40 family metallo-hydrolase [Fulvivirga sp.]